MPCEICSSINGRTLLKVEPVAYEEGLVRDRLIPKIPEEAKVDIEKINKTNLMTVFKDRPWLRKVKLERKEDTVIWRYEDFVDVFIREDGFYILAEDSTKFDLKIFRQRMYLIFSVLRQARMMKYD